MDDFNATRRDILRAMMIAVPAASLAGCLGLDDANASDPVNVPGAEWGRYATVEDAGFTSAGINAVETTMYPLETTSMMIVKAGKIAYTYGNVDDVAYLASARKSILSMLYGKYVANGTINLDSTLADLGIDDKEGLLPIEKTAKIRDLLTARSGVYHPAGSPGGSSTGPARGSETPGTYFLYNNWDFNVVGAIFEKLTGKTIFNAFAEDIAAPLQLQDFERSRQRMIGYKTAPSLYQAYHFFLSGRDMARLGVLMINNGRWNDKQIIPESWVKESTALRVPVAEMAAGGESGYGYLWWKPSESRKTPEWADSYLANGNYGQYILVLPAIDTVIVHRRSVTDEFAVARNLGDTPVDKSAVTAAQFLKLADQVIAARR